MSNGQSPAWWSQVKAIVWAVEAIQILGLGPSAAALVSAIVAGVTGFFEGVPIAALIPIVGGTFFVFLFGLVVAGERFRRWTAVKQSNPDLTAAEFREVIQAQKDFLANDAAWQHRTHIGNAILSMMSLWAESPESELEKFRKITATLLTVTFGKATRTEFLREVANAEPQYKRQVAITYLHGLVLRTSAGPGHKLRDDD